MKASLLGLAFFYIGISSENYPYPTKNRLPLTIILQVTRATYQHRTRLLCCFTKQSPTPNITKKDLLGF